MAFKEPTISADPYLTPDNIRVLSNGTHEAGLPHGGSFVLSPEEVALFRVQTRAHKAPPTYAQQIASLHGNAVAISPVQIEG